MKIGDLRAFADVHNRVSRRLMDPMPGNRAMRGTALALHEISLHARIPDNVPR